jgi:glycosyltransferase involved in cell wall biosynthesis
MELPYYFAMNAPMDVTVTTTEPVTHEFESNLGSLRCITEDEFCDNPQTGMNYDVVVHWRKWFESLYCMGGRNVILSQDHSYSRDWLETAKDAYVDGLLDGVLVFPTWHRRNTERELTGVLPSSRLYEGLTFGVDTSVYYPMEKDPFHLLWASDPGRGLDDFINPFLRLWQRDRRFRLTVTYPDYVRPEAVARFSSFLSHPAVSHRPRLRNGPELWNLFNSAGFLPYSSNFPEPSSRCHRQAMAAGCCVLYPPNMGTPSETIESGLTGVIESPRLWSDVIPTLVKTGQWEELGHNARVFAHSERWAVQAQRFYDFFSRGLQQ